MFHPGEPADYTIRIALLGWGRDMRAVATYLISCGYQPTQCTVLSHELDTDVLPGMNSIVGDGYLHGLESYDVIIRSPSVSPYIDALVGIQDRIISSLSIFNTLWCSLDPTLRPLWIGVTGTKGKTSMCTLLARVYRAAGYRVALVGNIGESVASILDTILEYDIIVYELSSYMLAKTPVYPDIGILLNLYPEHHLTWHNGLEQYRADKMMLCNNARICVVGEELPCSSSCSPTITYRADGWYKGDTCVFVRNDGFGVDGEHRDKAIAVAVDVLYTTNTSLSHLRNVLLEWESIPHRQEILGTYGGIVWINDAIATTPQSTMYALERFGDSVRTLFVGGAGDNIYDFSLLCDKIISSSIETLVCFPDTGTVIARILQNRKRDGRILHTRCMSQAVKRAYTHTPQGCICMLSCASPSYSIWRNFEEKGSQFVNAIVSYTQHDIR